MDCQAEREPYSVDTAPPLKLNLRDRGIATRLWRVGLDTNEIAHALAVDESAVYNALQEVARDTAHS
jgi:hypothetical protein